MTSAASSKARDRSFAARDEWIEAGDRHEALIPDDLFERVQAEMKKRSHGQRKQRRRNQQRFYLLRGIVHCATGHNPLRMQGKSRKEDTYYTCGYRLSYGDRAAQAVGHGKWQYVREEPLLEAIDRFFATRIFGPPRLAAFRNQHRALTNELGDAGIAERRRLNHEIAGIQQRMERQLGAIEAGVDPTLVGKRISALKGDLRDAETAITQLDLQDRAHGSVNVTDACDILDALPDLRKTLSRADPELRRNVYDAFRFSIEIDRNASQIKLKALISSAFGEANDLGDLADLVRSNRAIAGAGRVHLSPTSYRLKERRELR